jgi:hypothetical protein
MTSLVALLAAGSVAAQDVNQSAAPPAPPTATTPAGDVAAPTSSSMFYEGNKFGLQVDGGIPSLASVAAVYRPWRFLRVNAGLGYDVAALGVKGGVTFIPFHWGVVPTIGLEAGHFFEGDLNSVVNISDPVAKVLTKQLGFDYVTADLGLEFGAQNRFVFYIRAGISQVWGSVKNMNGALAAANTNANVTYKAADPSVEARVPSARLGFILYLF